MPSISRREICDRSKTDKFARLFACGQLGLLILQCTGRKAQNLPITTLEIATIGFAIPSVATFLLWFCKPADIEEPTMLSIPVTTESILERLSPSIYS